METNSSSETTMDLAMASSENGTTPFEAARSLKTLNAGMLEHINKQEPHADWSAAMEYYVYEAAKLAAEEAAEKEAVIKRKMQMLNHTLMTNMNKQNPDHNWSAVMQYYAQHAAMIQGNPIPQFDNPSDGLPTTCHLDRLPAELRYMIYEKLITPDMVGGHVTKGIVPKFLHVSHGIREEFANIYYSNKVFKVDFFNVSTQEWEEVVDPKTVRAIMECWVGCWVCDALIPLDHLQDATEASIAHDPDFIDGTLTWVGAPEGKGVACTFELNAMPSRVKAGSTG